MSQRVKPENRIIDIIRAAIDVFSRKGFRLAQMEEIAKEAGVAKGTLYNYFQSKVHLFHYVLEEGMPDENVPPVPPGDAFPASEQELLLLIKEGLREGSRLKSIDKFLAREAGDIDVEGELGEILEEWWDTVERNRVQVIVLEKSAPEFPELAEVFDTYARKQVLGQLERYLAARIRLGAVRPLTSVPATVRFILESVAWFGWRQFAIGTAPLYSKSEALPDLVSIISRGLRNGTPSDMRSDPPDSTRGEGKHE